MPKPKKDDATREQERRDLELTIEYERRWWLRTRYRWAEDYATTIYDWDLGYDELWMATTDGLFYRRPVESTLDSWAYPGRYDREPSAARRGQMPRRRWDDDLPVLGSWEPRPGKRRPPLSDQAS